MEHAPPVDFIIIADRPRMPRRHDAVRTLLYNQHQVYWRFY